MHPDIDDEPPDQSPAAVRRRRIVLGLVMIAVVLAFIRNLDTLIG